ncbi:MAG TPA: hypothetical protein VGY98_08065 [Verrucomicrobiae bacterium]|nr:hypothetical protein [Verrucomicrobiae bacterium]
MTPKFNSIISVFLGAVMAGCAGMKSGLVLDTAGPAPATAGKSNSDEGTLVVYSAYQINADFSSRDPNRREHSDYKILDQDKNTVKWVHNATDDMFQSAVSVKLSAGKYFIVARSNGFGIVTVPVVIAPGRNTALHLDAEKWLDESAYSNRAVLLPDGEIVGWKSASAN